MKHLCSTTTRTAVMKTLTATILLASVATYAFGSEYCNKINTSQINVKLDYDDDDLIYTLGPYYPLDNITFKYSFAHFKDQNITTFCKKIAYKVKRCKALLLDNINLKNVEDGAWKKFGSLKYLAIAHNNIPNYNIGISSIQDLKFISVQENKIENIEEHCFRDLPKLKKLYLHNNQISEIKNWFTNCSSLNSIRLDRNLIQKLPANAFKELTPKLTVNITLNHNKIEEIEDGALDHLRKIDVLNLAYNTIKEIPESFLQNLTGGRALYLNNNLLKHIPKHLFDKFDYINVDGNPIF